MGAFPRAGGTRPHDVRPIYGRHLGLHRNAGHPPGHVRNVRGGGRAHQERNARGPHRADGRLGRHGRRAAAGGQDGGRCLRRRRSRPRASANVASSRAIAKSSSTTRWRRCSSRRKPPRRKQPLGIALIGNAAQLFGRLRELGLASDGGDGPDVGARSAQRLRPGRRGAAGGRSVARSRSEALRRAQPRQHGAPGRGDARLSGRRRHHVRVRQLHSRTCAGSGRRQRQRHSGLRAAVRPPRFLPRPRSVPLGLPVGRACGPRGDRSRRSCACSPTTRCSRTWMQMAEDARADPGPSGADLLARARRARQGRPHVQRRW